MLIRSNLSNIRLSWWIISALHVSDCIHQVFQGKKHHTAMEDWKTHVSNIILLACCNCSKHNTIPCFFNFSISFFPFLLHYKCNFSWANYFFITQVMSIINAGYSKNRGHSGAAESVFYHISSLSHSTHSTRMFAYWSTHSSSPQMHPCTPTCWVEVMERSVKCRSMNKPGVYVDKAVTSKH